MWDISLPDAKAHSLQLRLVLRLGLLLLVFVALGGATVAYNLTNIQETLLSLRLS